MLLPAYNTARYLPEAIESILGQSYGDFELVIIDDCSTDETPSVITRYARKDSRIVVIRTKSNLGVARALNQGIDVAQGEYVARMDSDDVSLPERLEKQVDFLDTHPEVGVLGTQTLFIEEDGRLSQQAKWEKPASHNGLVWRLFYSTPFCHPSVMMRSRILREAGGYDPSYRNEDMQLWTRMAFLTRLANLNETLLYYRMPFKTHVQRLSYWEPHIQRVGREYAERLLGHEVDPELIRLFFYFEKYGEHLGSDCAVADIFRVCCLLQDIFDAMKDTGLFELGDIEASERLLLEQTERLVFFAFQGSNQ